MINTPPLVIAVDGPAASGKGTIAKALARHYGLPFMDTGKLYRACGLAVRLTGHDPYDADAAAQAARQLDPALLDDPDLMSALNSDYASIVSSHPAVRGVLFDLQRSFAKQSGGAVLDGRDIGTVVFPEAQVKLFITASVAERARRRFLELAARGVAADPAQVEAEIRDRDAQDANRPVAPLKPAPDAIEIDTTALNADQAFNAALALIRKRLESA